MSATGMGCRDPHDRSGVSTGRSIRAPPAMRASHERSFDAPLFEIIAEPVLAGEGLKVEEQSPDHASSG